MIEQLIKDLIAALNANTAAHMGAASTTSGAAAGETKTEAKTEAKAEGKAAAGKAAGKAAAKKDEPKGPTVEEMQAALGKVKEEQGAAAAKAIISDVAGVAKMAEIPADKVKAVFDAATAALVPADDTDSDDDI